jgi:hypothetical protein
VAATAKADTNNSDSRSVDEMEQDAGATKHEPSMHDSKAGGAFLPDEERDWNYKDHDVKVEVHYQHCRELQDESSHVYDDYFILQLEQHNSNKAENLIYLFVKIYTSFEQTDSQLFWSQSAQASAMQFEPQSLPTCIQFCKAAKSSYIHRAKVCPFPGWGEAVSGGSAYPWTQLELHRIHSSKNTKYDVVHHKGICKHTPMYIHHGRFARKPIFYIVIQNILIKANIKYCIMHAMVESMVQGDSSALKEVLSALKVYALALVDGGRVKGMLRAAQMYW